MKDAGIEIIRYRRKYTLNETFFETIDSEEKAYWLGFIAADGCVYRRTLSINLNIKDKAHLEKLIAILNSETQIKEIPGTGYGEGTMIAHLEINSKKLVDDLAKYGIVPRKSLILKPPQIESSLERHWIRGYFDGDGSIIPELKNGNAQLSFCGTKEVIRWIEYKLTNENSHSLYSRWKDATKNSYQFSLGGKDSILRYISYIYDNSTIYLDRKYKKVLELKSRLEK